MARASLVGGRTHRRCAALSGVTCRRVDQAAAGWHRRQRRGHLADVIRISAGTADTPVRLAVQHAANRRPLDDAGFDFAPRGIVHGHEPYSVPRTYYGTDRDPCCTLQRRLEHGRRAARDPGHVPARRRRLRRGPGRWTRDPARRPCCALVASAPTPSCSPSSSTCRQRRAPTSTGDGCRWPATSAPRSSDRAPTSRLRRLPHPTGPGAMGRAARRWRPSDHRGRSTSTALDDVSSPRTSPPSTRRSAPLRAFPTSRSGWSSTRTQWRARHRSWPAGAGRPRGEGRRHTRGAPRRRRRSPGARRGHRPAGSARQRRDVQLRRRRRPDVLGRTHLPARIERPPLYALRNHGVTLITFCGVTSIRPPPTGRSCHGARAHAPGGG